MSFNEVVLYERLRCALQKLNPNIPVEASEDAFRKVTVAQSLSLLINNRAFHRMLVDGVEWNIVVLMAALREIVSGW